MDPWPGRRSEALPRLPDFYLTSAAVGAEASGGAAPTLPQDNANVLKELMLSATGTGVTTCFFHRPWDILRSDVVEISLIADFL